MLYPIGPCKFSYGLEEGQENENPERAGDGQHVFLGTREISNSEWGGTDPEGTSAEQAGVLSHQHSIGLSYLECI